MTALAPPILHLELIERPELNRCLLAWGHQMGAWERPIYREWLHGLFHNGELVGVTAASDLIRETAAGLPRAAAFELGRLCASRRDICRALLRLWREFVFPAICREHGFSWVISYQDAVLHSGNLYRFDGWIRLGASSSGTDQRSNRKGRRKVIWGWCADPAAAAARNAA